MKHELWSVWKDGFNPKVQWAVQMPGGIVGFRTKRAATAFASGFRLATDGGIRPFDIRSYHGEPRYWIVGADGNDVTSEWFDSPEAAQEWLRGKGRAPAETVEGR